MMHRINLPACLLVVVFAPAVYADDAPPAPLPPENDWVVIEGPADEGPTLEAPTAAPSCAPVRSNACQPSACQPRACRPSACRPYTCQPGFCQPSACRPNACLPSGCLPSAGRPHTCRPGICLPDLNWGLGCQQGYVRVDALLLTLDKPDDRVLALTEQFTPLLATGDLEYDSQAGPRITVGYQLNPCLTLESTYFGMHYWESDAVLAADDMLRLPGPVGRFTADFSDADVMAFESAARLESVEVNLIRSGPCSNWSFLMGFRYLGFEEDLDIASLDLDSGLSEYDIDATNNLFGMQVGGRWQKQLGCRLTVDFVSKGGIFGNAAQQRTFLGDLDNAVVLRSSETDQGHVAFASEIGVNGTYQISSGLAVRGGYNWFWLAGVARASDQLDFTGPVNTGMALDTGTAHFHGPHAGLEARW